MSSEKEGSTQLGRRELLRLAGGSTILAVGLMAVDRRFSPFSVTKAGADPLLADPDPTHYMFLGGTDGWIDLPHDPPIGFYHPDPLGVGKGMRGLNGDGGPVDLSTYVFGFRNITDLDTVQRYEQKQRAQHSAPLFWVNEVDPANVHTTEFVVDITNLGLEMRPDLFDAHTLHWHGFRNVIPFFDGEPTGSVSVPAGTVFRYIYRPRDPGSYMYHCHVEDVEHVHMGMNGIVFVRPRQNVTGAGLGGFSKFLYNDGNGLTGYQREFAFHLSEVWAEAHWADAHIQLPEWSDYHPDFSLLNGRSYPDTIAPNAPFPDGWGQSGAGTVVALVEGATIPVGNGTGAVGSESFALGTPWPRPYMPVKTDVNGDLVPPAGADHLQYQPLSSLITCNAGEQVALRFSNLGFKEGAMTIDGIKMHVVGRDATLLRGRDGTDSSYFTHTFNIGAGESFDVIIEAPAYQGPGVYDTYLLYNRALQRNDNTADSTGLGGQATEIHVYPAGTLPAQTVPNT